MKSNEAKKDVHRSDYRRPFVDFYQRNQISPVHQDIADINQHFDRRTALWRHIGIPPGLLAGRSVVEFGPGSGFNALFTAANGPHRYLLVDGNLFGLDETKALLSASYPDSTCFEFAHSLVEDFDTEERFDLVICEGVIPFQIDPSHFTRTVARFVKPGGLLIITCIDSVSFFSEIIRRLFRDVLIAPDAPVDQQLDTLRPIFEPHLLTLRGRSRPVDDWLLDNIIQPMLGTTFSIPDAIQALADDFDVYGSSPHFMTDWRWYKDIHGRARQYNEVALENYEKQLLNLMDYRFVFLPQTPAVGRRLSFLCDGVFAAMKTFERGDTSQMSAAIDGIAEVALSLRTTAPATAASLLQAVTFLKEEGDSGALRGDGFISMFGRGQSYLSFIRR
jgi:2-polyprenyl-3-methyl-5-hydroxy-6-metoxy-1,4-benzoquinol methylase